MELNRDLPTAACGCREAHVSRECHGMASGPRKVQQPDCYSSLDGCLCLLSAVGSTAQVQYAARFVLSTAEVQKHLC